MYTVSQNTPDPWNLYYNFVKTALISIKIGTHNLHMIYLNYNNIRLCWCSWLNTSSSKRLMFSSVRAVLGRPLPALCSAKTVSLSCFKKSFSVVFFQPFVKNSFINVLAPQPFNIKNCWTKSDLLQSNTFCLFTNSCHLLWSCCCHGNRAGGTRPISRFLNVINLAIKCWCILKKMFLFWWSYANLL